MKTIKPFLFAIIIFSLISAACIVSGETQEAPTSAPVNSQSLQSTDAAANDQPTEEVVVQAPPATPEPTQAPATEEVASNDPLPFFREDFEGDLDEWTYFLTSGDENKMDLYTDDGYLVFDLEGEEQYVYVMYDPYIYENVKLQVAAENRGKNTNNISLICNYSEKYGWYEFNVTNGGMYYFYVYSELDGGYFLLTSGGSKNVTTGRHENIYQATCQGNKLALYINGILENEYTDNLYNLTEGQVGFGVSSFNVLPIIVYVDFVDILEY